MKKIYQHRIMFYTLLSALFSPIIIGSKYVQKTISVALLSIIFIILLYFFLSFCRHFYLGGSYKLYSRGGDVVFSKKDSKLRLAFGILQIILCLTTLLGMILGAYYLIIK